MVGGNSLTNPYKIFLLKDVIHISTYITGYEIEPFEHFELALLGFNSELTKRGLWQFAEDNEDQVMAKSNINKTILLKDGTRIKGIMSVDDKLRGYRFDQLILFDDERWNIEWHRKEDIRLIKALTMYLSNIPEEFQILKYQGVE